MLRNQQNHDFATACYNTVKMPNCMTASSKHVCDSTRVLCTMQESLAYFGHLTEAQQLQAANEFERRLSNNIRNCKTSAIAQHTHVT